MRGRLCATIFGGPILLAAPPAVYPGRTYDVWVRGEVLWTDNRGGERRLCTSVHGNFASKGIDTRVGHRFSVA